jgi:tetratricopeptide (TPR) repeat protein
MIGVIAAFLGGDEGRHFMMPGKLSSHHAGLTNCSTCHSGAQSGQVDLLHRLMTQVEPRQNSNLCLTCHVMGAEPFAPHTHAVDDLERRTQKLRLASKDWQPESLMQRIAFPATVKSRGPDAEIQCATCHKEHQGVFANLKAVSNQRCQTCHVSRFSTFADSHPQFDKFPYQRRPRIAFDHQSHMTKHFPEATKAAISGQVAPVNCTDCHHVGVRQRYMQVNSFATMCSGCHNGDITGATQVSGPKGIDVLAVPGLDVATLNERGIDIGSWPEKSEASLTPFMKLVLKSEGDDVVSGVAGFDLLDLRNANDQDFARVANLAWAVKRLFNRLETTNLSSAKLVANDALGTQIDKMAALTGGMSHDVIMAGNREWFPGLQDELSRHEHGEPTRDSMPSAKLASAPKLPPSSIDDSAKAAAKSPSADIPGGNAGDNKDDILGSGNGLASNKKDDILSKDDKSDILAPSKQDDILAPKKDAILGDKPAGDILSDAGDKSANPDQGVQNKSADVKKTAGTTPTQFDPEVWAQTGGWYRQDFTVRYRPTGHADQFLQTWLDFSGRADGTSLHEQLAPIFGMLSPKDSVGRCTKCHSIDDQAGAKLVNWLPFDPNALKNRFTNYSHKPHVELVGTKTCVKCHELQPVKTEFMKTYETGDSADYTPNFKPLDKAVCASCHSQQTAWENCTLCHGYHVLDIGAESPGQMFSGIFDKPVQPAKNVTAPSFDMEGDTGREYAMAEALGTEQALDGFIARHTSGRYHDLAIQQIAKLYDANKSVSVTPDSGLASESGKPIADSPRELAPLTNQPKASASDRAAGMVEGSTSLPTAEAARASPSESVKEALSDKLAAVTTESSPAKSLEIVPSTEEPTDLEGFLRRGFERAVHGDLQLAREDFDEVIRRDPGHAAALDDRCWVLALLDEVQAALEDCNASLHVAPNFADALDSRGFVNLKLGFYRKAIADYTGALSQFHGKKRASALYGRGIARRRGGNVAGAKLDIDAARAIKPTVADEFASYGIQ